MRQITGERAASPIPVVKAGYSATFITQSLARGNLGGPLEESAMFLLKFIGLGDLASDSCPGISE